MGALGCVPALHGLQDVEDDHTVPTLTWLHFRQFVLPKIFSSNIKYREWKKKRKTRNEYSTSEDLNNGKKKHYLNNRLVKCYLKMKMTI